MRKNGPVPFLLAVIGTALLAGVPAHAATPRETALAALDPIFEKSIAENHIPGLVYGVVADGKLVHVRAFGVQDTKSKTPVDADSAFRIASMSKQLLALGSLKLRDEGKLDLDAPAERYVPELAQLKYPTTDSPRVRVRDLLSHAGGFVTDDPWGDRQLDESPEEFSRFVAAGVPMSRAPGTAFEYSNFGYALVGRIVTNRAGVNYADYVTRSLFVPLGMKATSYDIARVPMKRKAIGYRWESDAWREEPMLGPGEYGAMGGVFTSANDYARYVAWVLAAWPPRDGAEDGILARASVREISRPQNFASVSTSIENGGCSRSTAYGFGVIAFHDCVLGTHFTHSGGLPGFGSNVLFLPNRGVGIFAFANRTYAPASLAVRTAAMQIVRSGTFPERDVPVSEAVAAMAAAALRIYDAGDVTREPAALAENLLLDRSARLRNAELAEIRGKVGACKSNQRPVADHALSATATFDCEHGSVKVTLLLAPTNIPSLQRLEYAIP